MKNFIFPFLLILLVAPSYAGDTITTASGLKYVVVKQGTGKKPVKGSNVKVNYKGMLTDGTVFDDSKEGGAFKFTVGNKEVIPGWDEGVQLMKEGEKGILIVPANLGYGKKGVKDDDDPKKYRIPPNSDLIFEIELLKVK